MNNRRDPSEWVEEFLESLRKMPVVKHACTEAKVSRTTVYNYRKQDPEFAQQWDDALEEGIDALEEKVWSQATDGDRALMMFLLKSLRPSTYREGRAEPPPQVKVKFTRAQKE